MNTQHAPWVPDQVTPLDTKNPLPPGVASLPAEAFKPTPLAWKGPQGQTCIVDKVLITRNDDANQVIKVWHVACCPPSPFLLELQVQLA